MYNLWPFQVFPRMNDFGGSRPHVRVTDVVHIRGGGFQIRSMYHPARIHGGAYVPMVRPDRKGPRYPGWFGKILRGCLPPSPSERGAGDHLLPIPACRHLSLYQLQRQRAHRRDRPQWAAPSHPSAPASPHRRPLDQDRRGGGQSAFFKR